MLLCWVWVAQSCPTVCDPTACSPPGSSVPGDSPGKNTGVGCHALLQGIFPSQGSNPGLLHCRRILYCLRHHRSPRWGSRRLNLISLDLDLQACFLWIFLPTPFFQLPHEPFSPCYLSKDILVVHRAISFSLSLLQTGGLRGRTVTMSYVMILKLLLATYKTTLSKWNQTQTHACMNHTPCKLSCFDKHQTWCLVCEVSALYPGLETQLCLHTLLMGQQTSTDSMRVPWPALSKLFIYPHHISSDLAIPL